MNRREVLELQQGLKSQFGRWLMADLAATSQQTMVDAIRFAPTSLQEQVEREQNFGKAIALADLVNQIPSKIDELMKTATKE